MTIPQNGRYVVRAELAAFAATTQEALLNATSHDQQVDFTLILASRAAQQEQQEERAAQSSQYSGRGTQSLSLTGAASDLIAAASGNEAGSEAQLPSLASNSDVSSESVAVAGQTGYTSPFAGINPGEGSLQAGGPDASSGYTDGPAAADPAAVAEEEEEAAVAEAGLAAAAAAVAAASADAETFATSIPTSPTEPSSGTAATPRSTPSPSPFAGRRSANLPTPPTASAQRSSARLISRT